MTSSFIVRKKKKVKKPPSALHAKEVKIKKRRRSIAASDDELEKWFNLIDYASEGTFTRLYIYLMLFLVTHTCVQTISVH